MNQVESESRKESTLAERSRRESKMEALPFRKESQANFRRESRKESIVPLRRESRMETILANSRRMSMYHRFSRFGAGSLRGTEPGSNGDGSMSVRYENTYRLGPPTDKKRFNAERVSMMTNQSSF